MQTIIVYSSIVLCALTGPLMAFVTARPTEGMPVMVIAMADSAERSAIVTRAGGRVIGPVQAGIGTLAISDDSNFFNKLHEEGAFFVVDGVALSEFCGDRL